MISETSTPVIGSENPFSEIARASRAKYEQRLARIHANYPGMFDGPDGRERLNIAVIRTAMDRTALAEAEFYEGQVAAFERGEIDSRGHAIPAKKSAMDDPRNERTRKILARIERQFENFPQANRPRHNRRKIGGKP